MAKRTGALELAVLGLLHDSPMHGYELRKQVNTLLGWGRILSYGSLYPCLKTLTKAGYIAAAPTPDARGKRNRIVYELTAEGKERFTTLIEESGPRAWEDDIFDIRFAFFSQTTSPTRVRILEGRRSRLEERLEGVRQSAAKGRQRADKYTAELRRHGLESVEREVRWLSDLIDQERASSADPREEK